MSDAYQIVDHAYDVVVVGAGGAGSAGDLRCGRERLFHRLHYQGVSHPQPHRGRSREA